MTVETFDFQTPNDAIVSVSDAAAAHFAKQVAASNAQGVRLSLKQAGCTGYKYVIDEVTHGDVSDMQLTLNNGVLLFVDTRYLAAIKGTEIDLRQQGLNMNLVMQNPNVQDECGCGESFSIQE